MIDQQKQSELDEAIGLVRCEYSTYDPCGNKAHLALRSVVEAATAYSKMKNTGGSPDGADALRYMAVTSPTSSVSELHGCTSGFFATELGNHAGYVAAKEKENTVSVDEAIVYCQDFLSGQYKMAKIQHHLQPYIETLIQAAQECQVWKEEIEYNRQFFCLGEKHKFIEDENIKLRAEIASLRKQLPEVVTGFCTTGQPKRECWCEDCMGKNPQPPKAKE